MTLSADEFLRRFLLHILPRGFTRIRHFGILANRSRPEFIPLCRQLLAGALDQLAHARREQPDCGDVGLPELRRRDDSHRAAYPSADPFAIC